MPHRTRPPTTADVPVQVMAEIVRDPAGFNERCQEYSKHIAEWKKAFTATVDRETAAGKAEETAVEREEAVAVRETAVTEQEAANAVRVSELDSCEASLVARDQEASAREDIVSQRETTLDDRLSAVRLDLAALKGL